MTPERWRQVCALFAAALRCAPAEREVLLREACAGHPELRTEGDRLLAGDARADEDGFLRVPFILFPGPTGSEDPAHPSAPISLVWLSPRLGAAGGS